MTGVESTRMVRFPTERVSPSLRRTSVWIGGRVPPEHFGYVALGIVDRIRRILVHGDQSAGFLLHVQKGGKMVKVSMSEQDVFDVVALQSGTIFPGQDPGSITAASLVSSSISR